MGWLKALLGALGAIFGFLRDRQLIDAGAARARAEEYEAAAAAARKGRAIDEDVEALSDDVLFDELHGNGADRL